MCDDGMTQWIGNGETYYPVYSLPKMQRENLFAIFDVPEEKRKDFYFAEQPLPETLNFGDFDDNELVVKRGRFLIRAAGRTLEPIATSQGIAFINLQYLEPFADEPDGFELYQRTDPAGNIYIAVKSGMLLLGLVYPTDIVDESFVQWTRAVYEMSDIALKAKAEKERNAERTEQQMMDGI